MEVTAVVVTYNRLELLKENIEALRNQTVSNFKILIVNNHSTDGTKEYIEKLPYENLCIMTLPENLGGAGGFYYGIKKAYEDGAEAVWIMDDDTMPQPDALENLLHGAKKLKADYGFLASDVRWIDNSPCIMNKVHRIKGKQEAYDRIDTATFVSLLIPRETIAQVGLPLKEYFIWGDDKEYTLRISDRLPCYFIPSSKVVHKMKVNMGSNVVTDEPQRIQRYFYAYRNDYATAKKRGRKYLLVYYAGFCLNALRILLYSKQEKKDRLNVMKRGLKAGRDFSPVEERI